MFVGDQAHEGAHIVGISSKLVGKGTVINQIRQVNLLFLSFLIKLAFFLSVEDIPRCPVVSHFISTTHPKKRKDKMQMKGSTAHKEPASIGQGLCDKPS